MNVVLGDGDKREEERGGEGRGGEGRGGEGRGGSGGEKRGETRGGTRWRNIQRSHIHGSQGFIKREGP